MLDLSNPAHVEALRDAAAMARDEPAKLERMAGAARGFLAAGTKTLIIQFAAALTLTDPTRAADLLRRLLERCGVDAEALNPRIMHLSRPVGAPSAPCVGYGAEDDRWHCITMDRIPSIVLALLDASDRDAALAVLRGER